jgi:Flp pilus assembly protein TadG
MTKPRDPGRNRGQTLVEFALVFPLLVLMIFGIVDAGRLVYTYNTVAQAARDGARVAIVNQSTSGTNTCDTTAATAYSVGCAISSATAVGLTAGNVSVVYHDTADTTTSPTDTTTCTPTLTIGCIAVVKVTGQFQPLTPVIGQLIGLVSLSSTAKVPIERVCSNQALPPTIPNC